MLLIQKQFIQVNNMEEILKLLFYGPEIEGLVYGAPPLAAALIPALAGAAGGLIKGIGSLFGRGRKRRGEEIKHAHHF